MDKSFVKAFSEIIREEVTQNNEVRIKGLGSFKLDHQKQYQKQFKNGRVVMMPPKDSISFTPEIN